MSPFVSKIYIILGMQKQKQYSFNIIISSTAFPHAINLLSNVGGTTYDQTNKIINEIK